MKHFTSKKQKIGELGESVACTFLMKRGFSIKERNYTRKYGEIDIVAEKGNKLYFVEVKSVSVVKLPENKPYFGTGHQDSYRPEDNLHPWKLKRLSRTIQVYLLNQKGERDWQFDVALVYLDLKNRVARVKMLEDIVL